MKKNQKDKNTKSSKQKSQPSVVKTPEFKATPHNEQTFQPVLRFTPYAWAKLLFFRDRGQCEIGGFGVCATEDPLLVTDFVTIQQNVSVVSVEFDDASVADFFDDQIDSGRRPQQFARIWAHTHPGESPTPSQTDQECFGRVFGGCDWAVMFILARGGKTFARLRFNAGPGGEIHIPVEVDYSLNFIASDHEAWEEEYHRNIHQQNTLAYFGCNDWGDELEDLCLGEEWIEELEQMEPSERQSVLQELQDRPDLWEGNLSYEEAYEEAYG